MATRFRTRTRVGAGGGAVDKAKTTTTDFISELPEHIVHYIISRLRCPKDVARISVLSKRWRSLWLSFFSFNFDQRSFPVPERSQIDSFKSFVDNALDTRLDPMPNILEFKLHITSFSSDIAPHIDRWITAAIDKKVKDLSVHLDIKNRKPYALPREVFTCATITSLKLHGCKFTNLGDVNLPNLIELSIKKAFAKVRVVETFISSCHLIQDLRLVECSSLEILHISTLPKLSRVEVHECHGLKSIEIHALNLESFWYYGKRSIGQCKIDLADCENLKILTLKDTYMTDELFQDHISKFPVLEKLVLRECNMLLRIIILSQKLQKLSLIRCKNLEEANIDAPNWNSFEYIGDKAPFSSMNISSLHEMKLCFESKVGNRTSAIHGELQKFLKELEKLDGFKMAVFSNNAVTIYEKLKEINIDSISDLKLEITKLSSTLEAFIHNSLREYQPKSLSIESYPSSKFLKFINDEIANREENPICCRYYSRKCWRHYLKDVEIHTFETAEDSSDLDHCLTSYNLKWNRNRTRWKRQERAN